MSQDPVWSGAFPERTPTLRIREMSPAERPRERLTRLGAPALSVVELLALVIANGAGGRSALDLSQDVFARAGGSLRRIATTPVAALTSVEGVGMARRWCCTRPSNWDGAWLPSPGRRIPLRGPHDVFRVFSPRLEDLPVEEFTWPSRYPAPAGAGRHGDPGLAERLAGAPTRGLSARPSLNARPPSCWCTITPAGIRPSRTTSG